MAKTVDERVSDRDQAISNARWIQMNEYLIIDTETTGLNEPEICQFAAQREDNVEYVSMVKPGKPIEDGATAVHHISNDDVKECLCAEEVIKLIRPSKIIVGYNVRFDLDAIQRSIGKPIPFIPEEHEVYDVMFMYSALYNEWDDYHGNYRWFKLKDACSKSKIEEKSEVFHDALFDVQMTRKLLDYIACQKLSTEVS